MAIGITNPLHRKGLTTGVNSKRSLVEEIAFERRLLAYYVYRHTIVEVALGRLERLAHTILLTRPSI